MKTFLIYSFFLYVLPMVITYIGFWFDVRNNKRTHETAGWGEIAATFCPIANIIVAIVVIQAMFDDGKIGRKLACILFGIPFNKDKNREH